MSLERSARVRVNRDFMCEALLPPPDPPEDPPRPRPPRRRRRLAEPPLPEPPEPEPPLFDAPEAEPDPEPVAFVPEVPKSYASKATWADYARQLGATITDDMTKAEIQAAARDIADDPARLPQPAPEGGRLETPEDEPVAEEVTHADPGQD